MRLDGRIRLCRDWRCSIARSSVIDPGHSGGGATLDYPGGGKCMTADCRVAAMPVVLDPAAGQVLFSPECRLQAVAAASSSAGSVFFRLRALDRPAAAALRLHRHAQVRLAPRRRAGVPAAVAPCSRSASPISCALLFGFLSSAVIARWMAVDLRREPVARPLPCADGDRRRAACGRQRRPPLSARLPQCPGAGADADLVHVPAVPRPADRARTPGRIAAC